MNQEPDDLKWLAMEAARELPPLMTVEEYLASEQEGSVRHEFIDGVIHAMSGASEAHNTISLNIAGSLRAALRGGRCRVYMADFKVRLEVARRDVFYYPDVLVSCHPSGIEAYYLRLPTLIFEVLSSSTEAIDRREKKMTYEQAPTLEEYVIVSQERREVTIYRRAQGWRGETYTAEDAVLPLTSVRHSLPLAAIYEDVVFLPRVREEE